jgi:hypothetical protein
VQSGGKPERRARSWFGPEADIAAHHLNQAPADVEAKACAAIRTGRPEESNCVRARLCNQRVSAPISTRYTLSYWRLRETADCIVSRTASRSSG